MRRRMVVKIHLNAAAVEPDDRGHKCYSSAYAALVQLHIDVRRSHTLTEGRLTSSVPPVSIAESLAQGRPKITVLVSRWQ